MTKWINLSFWLNDPVNLFKAGEILYLAPLPFKPAIRYQIKRVDLRRRRVWAIEHPKQYSEGKK